MTSGEFAFSFARPQNARDCRSFGISTLTFPR
jgi:hypothetical protein